MGLISIPWGLCLHLPFPPLYIYWQSTNVELGVAHFLSIDCCVFISFEHIPLDGIEQVMPKVGFEASLAPNFFWIIIYFPIYLSLYKTYFLHNWLPR